ncbi:MAG: NUDIX hydrolase [Sneathiella sp.]|nr:NUDIX hydrolase [Sneathiella sp.]
MNSISRPTRPVKPRNASSLVLYKQSGDKIFLLMGKRAKGHKFLPDVFVFPGGRVDTADFTAECTSPLPEDVARYLSAPGSMSHALAIAAVRETYEETGLVIGNVTEDKLYPDLSNLRYIARATTPAHNPIRFNTRFLMIDAKHATGTLAGSGELVDLQWFSIEDALNMPLVDVTEFVVGEVEKRLSNTEFETNVIPIFTYLNGKSLIRWHPH